MVQCVPRVVVVVLSFVLFLALPFCRWPSCRPSFVCRLIRRRRYSSSLRAASSPRAAPARPTPPDSTAPPGRWRRARALRPPAGRTPAGAPGSAYAPADRSRPRPSSTPRYGPGSGPPTVPRPASPASPPSAARTPRASTAPGNPRSAGSGSRPARTGRGTSRAGSPCPSCRANARTSQRSLPPAVSPTTLPGLRPLTPPYTTSRHSTPFSSTAQPLRPPGNPTQSPPAIRVHAAVGGDAAVHPEAMARNRPRRRRPIRRETSDEGERAQDGARGDEADGSGACSRQPSPCGAGVDGRYGESRERGDQPVPHATKVGDRRVELGQADGDRARSLTSPSPGARQGRTAPPAGRAPRRCRRRWRTGRPPGTATARGP